MITKTLNPNSLTSATSVFFKQKIQNTTALARDEKILVIGNHQDEKELLDNKIKQFSNADDVSIIYGFGSPLHRMSMKLFPNDNNGSKVETCFTSIDGTGTNHKIKLNVIGNVNKNFTAFLRFKEMEFEVLKDSIF